MRASPNRKPVSPWVIRALPVPVNSRSRLCDTLERRDSRWPDRCRRPKTHSDSLLTEVPNFRDLFGDPGFRFELAITHGGIMGDGVLGNGLPAVVSRKVTRYSPGQIQTKFLRLRSPVCLGNRIEGWRVCWLGGWDKGPDLFAKSLSGGRRHARSSRRKTTNC